MLPKLHSIKVHAVRYESKLQNLSSPSSFKLGTLALEPDLEDDVTPVAVIMTPPREAQQPHVARRKR